MDKTLNKLSRLYRDYADFTPEWMERAYKVNKVITHYLDIRYKILFR